MKWEYKEVILNFMPQTDLNRFGEEGWELIVSYPRGSDTYYIFKRPIEGDK